MRMPGGKVSAPAGPPEAESINARPWDSTGPTGPTRPTRPQGPPARILAVRLQAFGDTVLTLPYLQALRRMLPGTSLDFLTRSEVAELPRELVLFDHVFEIGGGRDPRRQLVSALALIPRLWARRYDAVIDLQRNRVSRVVRRLLHPRSWSEFDRYSPMLAGERTRLTIEALGFGSLHVRPDLKLKAPEAGLRKLHGAGWDAASDLVVLNPAGAFPGRNWPLPHYVEFCRLWVKRRARPVRFLLLGLPRISERAAFLRTTVGDAVIDLVGRDTPSEAFAILQRATLVLSEDSGLMHLAWVAGAPTLGLFGTSRSAWARPHGNYSDVIATCREPDGVCLDGVCRAGSPNCLARQDAECGRRSGASARGQRGRLPKIISSGV